MNSLYVVLIASLLVWGGLFFYLVITERRVAQLEQRLRSEDQE
jgi:CcmD family protein